MDANQSTPPQAPAPAPRPGWAVRLLERLGLTLPTSWSATKADIVGKVVVTLATTAILGAIYWLAGLARDGLDYAYRETKDYVVGLPKADPNAPLSILVARLEDSLGVDPFSETSENLYPVNLGDFIQFYENAAAQCTVDSGQHK